MTSVEDIFLNNNIELQQMSKISLIDRVHSIRSSKSIAGIFGAGFANIVFASHRSRVLFICHPEFGIPAEYLEIFRIKNISLKIYSEYRMLNKVKRYLRKFTNQAKKRIKINKHNTIGWKINLVKLEKAVKNFYQLD